jgi:hypothetical protein
MKIDLLFPSTSLVEMEGERRAPGGAMSDKSGQS